MFGAADDKPDIVIVNDCMYGKVFFLEMSMSFSLQ